MSDYKFAESRNYGSFSLDDLCVCVKLLWPSPILCNPMERSLSMGLLCLWDSLGKNTGVGCHSLLQILFYNVPADTELANTEPGLRADTQR